jgi:hypothetical protein
VSVTVRLDPEVIVLPEAEIRLVWTEKTEGFSVIPDEVIESVPSVAEIVCVPAVFRVAGKVPVP